MIIKPDDSLGLSHTVAEAPQYISNNGNHIFSTNTVGSSYNWSIGYPFWIISGQGTSTISCGLSLILSDTNSINTTSISVDVDGNIESSTVNYKLLSQDVLN